MLGQELFAIPGLADLLFRVRPLSPVEILECGPDALQFEKLYAFRIQQTIEPILDLPQDQGVRNWRDRERRFPVVDSERAVLEDQLELAPLKHLAVLTTEEGQEHLAAQLTLDRIPVDIEVVRVAGSVPVLEHVLPPDVLPTLDAHVVWHEIDDQPQVTGMQRRDEGIEIVPRSDLGIQHPVVDHVVAVHGPRRRPEHGGHIDMGDAEIGQVRHDPLCIAKGELVIELQPIGRTRDGFGEKGVECFSNGVRRVESRGVGHESSH